MVNPTKIIQFNRFFERIIIKIIAINVKTKTRVKVKGIFFDR